MPCWDMEVTTWHYTLCICLHSTLSTIDPFTDNMHQTVCDWYPATCLTSEAKVFGGEHPTLLHPPHNIHDQTLIHSDRPTYYLVVRLIQ